MPKTPNISDAEWRVMRTLWDASPQTANEVADAVAAENDWSPRTVKTLLNRLVNKGALRYRQEGRLYQYYPAVSEEACVREESRSFLERVYGGALSPMLANMIQEVSLSDEEVAELKRLLDQRN